MYKDSTQIYSIFIQYVLCIRVVWRRGTKSYSGSFGAAGWISLFLASNTDWEAYFRIYRFLNFNAREIQTKTTLIRYSNGHKFSIFDELIEKSRKNSYFRSCERHMLYDHYFYWLLAMSNIILNEITVVNRSPVHCDLRYDLSLHYPNICMHIELGIKCITVFADG